MIVSCVRNLIFFVFVVCCMVDECVFCKIASGAVDSYMVYDGVDVMAFLDSSPVSRGHVLVIPKMHVVDSLAASDEVLQKVIVVAKKMGLLLKERLGATGVNIVNASGVDAQQSVFHLHYHVVARYEDDGLDLWFHGEESDADLEEVCALLRS